MNSQDYVSSTIEAPVRSLDDRPEEELLKSGPNDPDLHTDPDAERALEGGANAPSAAAAAVTNWRVAKSLLALREQVNAKFPGRSKASDGTIGDDRHCGHPGATSDHCPHITDGGVGVVTAMDITHDPAHGLNSEALAEAIRQSHDVRLKYIISNRKIANFQALEGKPPFAWRPYGGPDPHDKHVHISTREEKSNYDNTSTSWTIG
jgi:hypothetical protein